MKNAFFLACVCGSCAAYVCSAQPVLDDGLSHIIAELKELDATSSSEQLYRKRLLMLLPRIQQSADVNLTTPETKGNTALHYACAMGNVELVQWLISHGADLEARTDKGATVDACIGSVNASAIRHIIAQARDERTRQVALMVTDGQDASASLQWLETALLCQDVTGVDYEIPELDEDAKNAAELLFHYVKSQKKAPLGTQAGSFMGQMIAKALRSEMSESQFCERILAELQSERENKLDALMENASYFADALIEIAQMPLDAQAIYVCFDAEGNNAPTVRVERPQGSATPEEYYPIKLHFCGRVPYATGAESTLLLMPEYGVVDVAEPEARFDADIARHFGKHCRFVAYFGETGDSLNLYYTPDGEINEQRTKDAVPQDAHGIPVYFTVTPASK